MTSINTNIAAMTALQTLQQTNNALESTQSRISTGFRVAEAKDNAAYWSIATTMRSDNMAMSAVRDSLGIGAATVDTAYTALDSTKDVLNEIKAKLTAATQGGVDRTKIQDEISQLQEQLRSIATSASFSGQNWLAINSGSSGFSFDKQVVSNLARSPSGTLTIGTITVDTSRLALLNADANSSGLLEKSSDTKVAEIETAVDAALDIPGNATAGTATTKGSWTNNVSYAAAQNFTLAQNDIITFDIQVGSADATQVVIDKNIVDTALGTSNGVVDTKDAYAKVLKAAFDSANLTGGAVSYVSGATTVTTANDDEDVVVGNFQFRSVGATDINITNVSPEVIRAYISIVDNAIGGVTAGASTLGAIQNRIDMQTDFVSKLMDTITAGVGTLVDADMTEESTRLKALQTQQQLGVQALSIANNSTQAIMQLFQ